MTSDRSPKTLRRRLFTSHLIVMGVALGVLFVGASIVFGVLQLVGEHGFRGRGGDDGEGPIALLVGLGAAAAASGLVSWRVARRLAEPLEEVGAATRELAAGRYSVRVPGADTAELDALADDVNRLASELHTTEQRRLRLIGDVAHELRNPLSTVEGTMEALLDGVIAPSEDVFARIGREAARLRRLADDLSSLSSAGEFQALDREEVDLAALAADVVAQLEPQAAATGLELRIEASDAEPADVDRDRITQVLMNVVGNAIQYTERGGATVAVSGSPDIAAIDVVDSGRGLAPEDRTRIFERFHRVDEHFSDGTGVGPRDRQADRRGTRRNDRRAERRSRPRHPRTHRTPASLADDELARVGSLADGEHDRTGALLGVDQPVRLDRLLHRQDTIDDRSQLAGIDQLGELAQPRPASRVRSSR